MRTFKPILLFVILLIAVLCMIVPATALADIPGSGGTTTDPAFTVNEVAPTDLGISVNSGDVILCEFGATCSLTSTTGWSDVLVFAPVTGLADSTATLFSADSTDLSSFLGNLSSNASIIPEAASGPTTYSPFGATYTIDSPLTAPTPEPGSMLLLGSGLLGLAGFLRRRRAVA